MKKILFSLFLFAIVFVNAQNDDCSGAISLTIGTDFTSGVITSNNTGATTDGSLPSCNSDAVENVWFTVVVPQSGNLKIETKEASGSGFDDTVLTVYSGSCGFLTEIDCNEDDGDGYFSLLSLTGQTPGATLYISVWKYDDTTDSGDFQISAYDPVPPANDDCTGAIALTVGTNFASGAITSDNSGASTDQSSPSCNPDAIENVWFTAVVPPSGNIAIETRETFNSAFYDSTISIYSGDCNSLTEIVCEDYFSPITLTGQTPGATLYISVWKAADYADNGAFEISAYDPIPPANDDCTGAIALTVGTNFASGAITSDNTRASTDQSSPSCNPDAIENVWFTAVVPPSGNIAIETRETFNSAFYDSTISIYSGDCNSLAEIACEDYFSPITLTGQTPGATLYISVWKYDDYADNGAFEISAYELIPPANDDCTGAIALTVGTNFASGAITSDNTGASTDQSSPSCNPDAIENVWFTAVVPPSGNIAIETRETFNSAFYDSTISVYSGDCNSLTEIACKDDFGSISLTSQTPGATLYISVWKSNDYADNGEFEISAYEFIPPSNDNCSGASPLNVGTDFASGSITSDNTGATIDGSLPTCNSYAVENVWFTVVVPQSGNLKIETKEASGSGFDDAVLTAYSGSCGSLTEVGCNEDGGDGYFSLLSLTGQTPGTTLYISVWKYRDTTDSGEFQIAAYDDTLLSTHEVSDQKEKIKIFPNPFTDLLNISDVSHVKSIHITDISGRLTKVIKKPSSSIYLGDLKQGMYLITLNMEDGTSKTIKTIKK
ncbi:T9SS type A sorting domain-containing protein [Chryseobacterium sp. WG23]|uniref:T9SS type A sorting domain-containing protein n=1 Tax=Chryseobacterium sp. WG23 TaxID=2926910 RepID=UPI00211E103A|nr:T9SS type A sorting domain-containing protein [Chryseobacterium sp. WG23]MCQ9635306.1 T9SS type A sorting domain-containing protein [Chryseobacterium sp. WG23]